MNFLYYCQDDNGKLLQAVREKLGNSHHVFDWLNDQDIPLENIDAAIVWLPPDHFFEGLPNLTHVYALAAGVDHLLKHPGLPPHANVVRLRDAGMGEQMAEYALLGTLMAQRKMVQISIAQSENQWRHEISADTAISTRVGVLGAGALGSKVAERLALNNYPVTCWSRSPHTLPKPIVSMHGANELDAFLAQSNVLVCLLPLTENTHGILNGELFDKLPTGAFLINPGRGGHLVDDDLIEALDSGKLSGALLDVFHEEPLVSSHPFWNHPKIIVTPHVAAKSVPDKSADQIIDSIRHVERGDLPPGLVNRDRGY